MRHRRINLALVELLVALLFFSLSSIVILRLFAATYETSTGSDEQTRAVHLAQNWADTAYAHDFSEDELVSLGWRAENGALLLDEDGFFLTMTLAVEQADVGRMMRGSMTVTDDDRQTLFTLPLGKFITGEADSP